MISFGKNIKDASTALQKTPLEQIFKAIQNPKEETRRKILQLRNILVIDANRYRQIKTQLPFICCGIFSPAIRRTENFAFTEYFILDIDHLISKEINIKTLKQKIILDNRVALIFNSPSNDGLKIVFKLKERCYDAAKFTLFYKLFAQKFSKQYGLEQVLDTKTSDVTRACFVSHDTNAYYNKTAECIDMSKYINFNNFLEVENAQLHFKDEEKNKEKTVIKDKTIPIDIFAEIKQKLNNRPKINKAEKIIYIPEELENILDKVKIELYEYNIEIENITNIHYGKKLKVINNNQWAEINIFYGKRGFTVVQTPKRGSNLELCELSAKITSNLLQK